MSIRTWRGTTSAAWNVTTNWLESAVPTSSDSVVFDSSSNHPMTITAAAACGSINFTNYTNTFTINSGQILTVSGNITLVTGFTFSSTTGTLVVNTSGTLTSGGQVINCNFTFGGTSQTYTIAGGNNWICSGTLAFNGTTGITVNNSSSEQIEGRGSMTFTTPCSGTASILISGTGTIGGSGTGTIGLNMTINTSGTITLGNMYFGAITFTMTSGTINPATSTILLRGPSVTLNCPSMSFYNLQINPAAIADQTITINSLLSVNNILSITNNLGGHTVTFAGSSGFSVYELQGLNGLSNLVLTYGNTYTITNAFVYLWQTSSGNTPTVKSSSIGNKVTLTLNSGASCQLGYVNFTDVDSSGGRTITTFDGTLSDTLNILSFTDLSTIGYTGYY